MQVRQQETVVPASSPPPRAISLPEWLRTAADLVAALGTEFDADRERLIGLQERLRAERCHLAVLGQFKRGKSTLINALLGAPVLPSAIVPLTSIPTFLHGGDGLTARVVFENDKPDARFAGADAEALGEFLRQFVTEEANPRNRLGVEQVEVTCPAAVLQQGLVLIDTPGIGSTFRHNTEATLNFLPQCDAAIFVVSADPPITEVEVEFLKLVRGKLARLFFVLNKADYLDPDERRTAVAFLQRVLHEQAGFADVPPIFCVSARQGLAARQKTDAAAWEQSGMNDVEQRIVEFLLTEKTDVLQRALARQAADLLADVSHRLELTRRSLQLPLADLDARIQQFADRLVEIEEQRIVLLARLARDEERLAEAVAQRAAPLLPKCLHFLQRVVQESQERDNAHWTEESARAALADAIPSFFEREFGAAHQACDAELRAALQPHRRRAEELIATVQRIVSQLFDLRCDAAPKEIALTTADRPYWRTHRWVFAGSASIPPSWIDRLLPQRLRHARIRHRLTEYVEYLATRNVGDLRSSITDNLHASIQTFRDRLTAAIEQTIHTTRTAIETARRRRTEDSASVAPELARLEAALADLQTLRQHLAPLPQ